MSLNVKMEMNLSEGDMASESNVYIDNADEDSENSYLNSSDNTCSSTLNMESKPDTKIGRLSAPDTVVIDSDNEDDKEFHSWLDILHKEIPVNNKTVKQLKIPVRSMVNTEDDDCIIIEETSPINKNQNNNVSFMEDVRKSPEIDQGFCDDDDASSNGAETCMIVEFPQKNVKPPHSQDKPTSPPPQSSTLAPGKRFNKMYYCSDCRAVFSEIHEHERPEDQVEKTFSCDFCEEQFSSKFLLLKHSHLCTKRCTCQLCGHFFNGIEQLRNHMVSVHSHPSKDNFCTSRSYLSENTSNDEYDDFHNKPSNMTDLPEEDLAVYSPSRSVFPCTECDRVLPTIVQLRLHRKSQHPVKHKPKRKVQKKALIRTNETSLVTKTSTVKKKKPIGRPRKLLVEMKNPVDQPALLATEIKRKNSVGRPRKSLGERKDLVEQPSFLSREIKKKNSIGRPRKSLEERKDTVEQPALLAREIKRKNSIGRPRKSLEERNDPVELPAFLAREIKRKNSIGRPKKLLGRMKNVERQKVLEGQIEKRNLVERPRKSVGQMKNVLPNVESHVMEIDQPIAKTDITCTFCQVTVSSQEFAVHEATCSKRCTCPFCGKAFQELHELKKHMFRMHSDSDSDSDTDTDSSSSTKYPCSKCDSVLSTSCNLKRHIRSCHSKSKKSRQKLPQASYSKGSCHCSVCNLVLSRANMSRHYRTQHHKTQLRIKRLEFITSRNKDKLPSKKETKQKQAELLNKKFKCEECGLRLSCEQNLKRHMRSHDMFLNESREKSPEMVDTDKISKDWAAGRFRCGVCGRVFLYLSNLERHTTVHSEATPFQCQVCFTRFTKIDHLEVHFEKFHIIDS